MSEGGGVRDGHLRPRTHNPTSHLLWLPGCSVKYHLSTYSKADFRDLKRIMLVFLPLPIYWALFYQQNSTWVDQASDMNTTIIWNTPGE